MVTKFIVTLYIFGFIFLSITTLFVIREKEKEGIITPYTEVFIYFWFCVLWPFAWPLGRLLNNRRNNDI